MARTLDQLPPEIHARYPYTSQFVAVNGRRMHLVDVGPPDARPVLLLHGNPTWGFLWRDVVPPLLEAGLRVVVPDLIGFGLSEKPTNPLAQTLDNQAANLVALLDVLDLSRLTVVCHDWGGPTGLSAVLTRPARVAALAVMSTWAWARPSSEFHRRTMPWRTMHAPLVGPHVLGTHAAMPGRGMALSTVDRAGFVERGLAGQSEVLGDPDERTPTWTWPRWIPVGLGSDVGTDRFAWLEEGVAALRLPSTVIWGREDDVFTPEPFASRWHELWPHAEGTHWVTGRHFLQEDSGAAIGALLAEFTDRVVS